MSKLYAINVDELSAEYEHTIRFENKDQQIAFFKSKEVDFFDTTDAENRFTFIRPEEVNVHRNYNELRNVGYVMIEQEIGEDEEVYFAFVSELEYINADVTKLHLEIDVLQTYQFDVEIGKSYVEREHHDRFDITNTGKELKGVVWGEPTEYDHEIEDTSKGVIKIYNEDLRAYPTLKWWEVWQIGDIVRIVGDDGVGYTVVEEGNYKVIEPKHHEMDEGIDYGEFYEAQRLKTINQTMGTPPVKTSEFIPVVIVATEDFQEEAERHTTHWGFEFPYTVFITFLHRRADAFGNVTVTRAQLCDDAEDIENSQPFVDIGVMNKADILAKENVLAVYPLTYAPFYIDGEITGNIGYVYRKSFKGAGVTPHTNADMEVEPQTVEVGGDTFHWYRVKSIDQKIPHRVFLDEFPKVDVKGDFTKTTGGITSLFFNADFLKGQPRRRDNETKLFTDPFFKYAVYNHYDNIARIKHETLKDEPEIRFTASIAPQMKEGVFVDTKEKFKELQDEQVRDVPLLTDAYLQYITNQRASSRAGVAVGATTGLITTLTGIALTATGVGAKVGVPLIVGGLVSIGATVGQEIAKRKDLQDQPDQARTAGNNLNFDHSADFYLYHVDALQITDEAKERVEDYFFRFGYKTMRHKVPNMNTRFYFNYVKLIEAKIIGNIAQEHRQKIKDIYRSGVTIWHYRGEEEDLFNYDAENFETKLIEE